MKKYDYVLVGAGLYSGVIAYLAGQAGKSCLVLERRDHTGGNIYCEEIEGIHVHKYGAHIFHTSNKEVWQFVNSLAEFNRYTNSPIANYKGEIYNMPFNMNTFSKMWGIRTDKGMTFSKIAILERLAVAETHTVLIRSLIARSPEEYRSRCRLCDPVPVLCGERYCKFLPGGSRKLLLCFLYHHRAGMPLDRQYD